jgi:Putative MetA-pathway of phenol degradation
MKNGRLAALVLVATSACAAPALAQSDEGVDADRPDVTNSTHIVPAGLVQIEFGGIYTRDTPSQSGASSPFTIRVGLADWVEARIGADGVAMQNGPDANGTGFGNVQVGSKLRLWADPGGVPVLSILTGINLPTADSTSGLGSGDVDYVASVLTGTDFARRGHIDVNYGLGALGAGQGRPHYVQQLISASVSAAVTEHFNQYVEVFWFSRTDIDGAAETSIDTGVIYELGSRFAIDGGVQFGIAGPAPDFGAFGGLTVIVGNKRTLNGRQRTIKARKATRH